MQCPNCKYVMGDFEKECPRCALYDKPQAIEAAPVADDQPPPVLPPGVWPPQPSISQPVIPQALPPQAETRIGLVVSMIACSLVNLLVFSLHAAGLFFLVEIIALSMGIALAFGKTKTERIIGRIKIGLDVIGLVLLVGTTVFLFRSFGISK